MPTSRTSADNPMAARFKRILQVMSEHLKPHGFRKRRQHFLRPVERIVGVISVDRSKFSNRHSMIFSSQVGPVVPGYWAVYMGDPDSTDSLRASDAPFDETLGYLSREAGHGRIE